MLSGDKKFSISLRALYRTFGVADHAPVWQRAKPAINTIANFGVERGISNDTTLADASTSNLILIMGDGRPYRV